jgi:uncharacterized protein YcaQ
LSENPVASLSLETARSLAVLKQGLVRRPESSGKPALLDAIRRIGILQLDSVNVVARSHYLVMLSRVGHYDPRDLDALLHPDRQLFEQWAHAACLIPIEDYPHYAAFILSKHDRPFHPWLERRLGGDPQSILDTVYAEVRERGPLASRDFEDPGARRGGWWNWKPAKTALEVLFERGYLMVDRRENFQRYYDLAERVLPASTETPAGTVDDWWRWATLRSVFCFGVATYQDVGEYYRRKRTAARTTVEDLAAEGALVRVEIEGRERQTYMVPSDLHLLGEIEAGIHQPTLTTFLSPFDNLIWGRERVRELFGFDYRIEMYTPAAKRKYGYYVLPILHRGSLVGRLDPKVDRKKKTLIVRAIYLEDGQEIGDELLEGIRGALREFMIFHECDSLVVERSEPPQLAPLLERCSL